MHAHSMVEKSKVVDVLQQVLTELNLTSYKIEITEESETIHVLLDMVYASTIPNIDSIVETLANSNPNLKICFVSSNIINTL